MTTGQPPVERGRHIPALDGVRGIAVLMVVIYHFFVIPQTRSTLRFDEVFLKIAGVGWAGVDLFFVLSGFLITGILLDAKGGTGYFGTFYARRFLRIFPVYYLTLACLLFVLPIIPWFGDQPSIKDGFHSQFWFWSYLVNIRIVFLPLASTGFAFGHFWSLAVEEQFYLLWPAIVLLCGRRTLIGVCCACIIGALALRIVFATADIPHIIPTFAMSTLMPSRMDTLAVGALIAVLAREPAAARELAGRYAAPVAVSAFVVLLALALFTDDRGLSFGDYWVQTAGFSAFAALFGAFVLWSISTEAGSMLDRCLRQPVLTAFGRVSYALYVVHLPVAVFLVTRIQEHNRWPLVAGSDLLARLGFAFIGISISFAIAWASWHLIEQPILRLKRHFPYDRRHDPGIASTRSLDAVSGGVVTSEPRT